MGHLANQRIRFDIAAERRWVWQRAHSLGWTAERFESFERTLRGGRDERRIERIGKKYQWIAWHELQARLSDHLYFIGDSWDDSEKVAYDGPWQLGARDIDPSLLMHSEDRDVHSGYSDAIWWRPTVVSYGDETAEERIAQLWSAGGMPELKSLLRVQSPDGMEWFVLNGMSTWRDHEDDRDPRPRRDAWLRIETFVVSRADVPEAMNALKGKSLTDPHELENRLDFDTFLGEYSWRRIAPFDFDSWREPGTLSSYRTIPVRYLVPTVEYACESGRDRSFQGRIELQLPVAHVRENLRLHWEGGRGATFSIQDSVVAFFDPTTESNGPPTTLVACEPFLRMLDSLDLALVWRIGGEKGLYGRRFDGTYHGRQIVSGVFHTAGVGIVGEEWRNEERPKSGSDV